MACQQWQGHEAMDRAVSPSSLCSDVVVEEYHLSMGLTQSLGLRHLRHSRQMVYFAEFGLHRVGSLYLRRTMIREGVMAA